MGTSVVVTFVPGLPVSGESSIVASPGSAEANGTAQVALTVVFKDSTGNPVPGKSVSVQGHGSATLSPVAALTDANGQAQFTLTDTVAETLSVSGFDASDVVAAPPTTVTFTPIPSEDTLDIQAGSATNPDDGIASDTLTVTVTNNGTPVEGKTVSIMESNGAHANVTPATAVTDANGKAVFTVTDAKAESVTFTPVEA